MKKYVTDAEMTFEEIARELDISSVHVRVTYVRAMRKVMLACKKYGISVEDIIGKPKHALVRIEESK